jgi:hypothetical protein
MLRVPFDLKLTADQFKAKYENKSPVLFTPVLPVVSAAHLHEWSPSRLLEVYGQVKPRIAARARAGENAASAGALDLAAYVSKDAAGHSSSYMFDSDFLRGATSLTSTLNVPTFLTYPPSSQDFFFLAMGGAGTGAGFHRHAPSWNLVISGQVS